jgi:hypothetical protein
VSNLHINVLNKPCMVCGQLNRFHKIFFCADRNYYMKQGINDDWNGEPLVTGHYAIVDNLTYLEYKANVQRS